MFSFLCVDCMCFKIQEEEEEEHVCVHVLGYRRKKEEEHVSNKSRYSAVCLALLSLTYVNLIDGSSILRALVLLKKRGKLLIPPSPPTPPATFPIKPPSNLLASVKPMGGE